MRDNQSNCRIQEKLLKVLPLEFPNDKKRVVYSFNKNNGAPANNLEQPIDFRFFQRYGFLLNHRF